MSSYAAGEETLDVLGGKVIAQKYVVEGDVNVEVWFTAEGALVRMEFTKAGGRVIMALESVTPAPGSALLASR